VRPLSALELLGVWEQGLAQPAGQRALTLLAAACPETSPSALAELSIGQRDTHLLTLREWTFGSHLVSLATCPGCGQRLELAFNVADIQVETPTQPSPYQGEGKEGIEALSLTVAGYEVNFRLPNSLDLIAIANYEDAGAAKQVLLERCLLAIRHDGEKQSVDQLPANVVAAVAEQMAHSDPQADVQLDLTCPDCSHQWPAVFDILSFFWREINTWAHRTLADVHRLASAYGWREVDILAISPWRRQYYLELVGR